MVLKVTIFLLHAKLIPLVAGRRLEIRRKNKSMIVFQYWQLYLSVI